VSLLICGGVIGVTVLLLSITRVLLGGFQCRSEQCADLSLAASCSPFLRRFRVPGFPGPLNQEALANEGVWVVGAADPELVSQHGLWPALLRCS
jgi:hypothetical protein